MDEVVDMGWIEFRENIMVFLKDHIFEKPSTTIQPTWFLEHNNSSVTEWFKVLASRDL